MSEIGKRYEPQLNEAQQTALQGICDRYGVGYNPTHYLVYPADAVMMPGWAEGWVGGADIQQEHRTIYVGCSPDGEINS